MAYTPTEFPYSAWITFSKKVNTTEAKIDRPPSCLEKDVCFFTNEGVSLIVKEVMPCQTFLVDYIDPSQVHEPDPPAEKSDPIELNNPDSDLVA